MTLLLVFRATDGLLAVCDGRTSTVTEDGLRPMSDDAVKSCIAPRPFPAVVLASGRATFNGVSAADVISQSDLTGAASVQAVAETAWAALLAAGSELVVEGSGVWAFVVGYDPEGLEPVVLEFTAPDATDGIRPAPEFRSFGAAAVPPTDSSDLVLSAFGHLSASQFDLLLDTPGVTDEAFIDDYSLAGSDLSTVRATVEASLARLVAADGATLEGDGVGGSWRFHELRPGFAVVSDTVGLGPWMQGNS